MIVQATVILPISDGGAGWRHSLASAQAQTATDIEFLVVSHALPPGLSEAAGVDPRVRFLDVPGDGPGPGWGCLHHALLEVRGRVVCYLQEGDLYLPHHVETLIDQLRRADFAHGLALDVVGDGRLHSWTQDLAVPQHRARFLEGRGSPELFGVPLSAAAHTLEVYHRLEGGWAGAADEQDLWRQLLRLPGCRVAATHRPSVLRLATPERADWPPERRLPELAVWEERLAAPGTYTALLEDLLRDKLAELARTQAERDLAWEGYGEAAALLGLAYHQLRKTRDELAPTRGKPEQAALFLLGRLRTVARLLKRYLPIGR
jgi:hypothetical protein